MKYLKNVLSQRYLVFLLFFTLTVTINALPVEKISGNIRDAKHQQPIPGVQVNLESSALATTTDRSGYFELDLPASGDYQLHLSHIGYQDRVIEIIICPEYHKTFDIFMQSTILRGNEVMVTATRTSRSLAQIPGRAEVIMAADFNTTTTMVDAVLQRIPGINIHRTSGAYEIRPVISMRGVGGDDPGRTLILLNGVPLNKSDTGVANLKRIQLQQVDRIEVLKGAGSALYGASAMGGVVNILTRPATDRFSGRVNFRRGTHNTQNIDIGLAHRFSNGFEFVAVGYAGNSDGYYDLPDTLRNEYTVPLFFNEAGGNAQLGWTRSPALSLKLHYAYDKDQRGEGYQIEHALGNHRAFSTQTYQLSLTGQSRLGLYNLTAYRQHEDYLRVSESFKRDAYNRFDVKSDRIDQGLTALISREISATQTLTFGLEGKTGSVDGGDFYITSPDTVLNQGQMDYLSAYIQEELQLRNTRLRILASLRHDLVSFHNCSFTANQPNNAFYEYNGDLAEHTWSAWSPRFGLRYVSSAHLSAYANYSRGFRAAPLDDICRSGFMRLGPKLANPELGPETIDSFEMGLDFSPNPHFSLAPSLYLSQGKNFLYYVATGDSLWGRRPIFQRENVTSVGIQGGELEMIIQPFPTLQIAAHLTFNRSIIDAFDENPDLEGKDLVLTPREQAGLNLLWDPSWATFTLNLHYKGTQYTDDANTVKLAPYTLIDLFASKTLLDHLQFTVGVTNLSAERNLEDLERLSPGRLYQLQLSYLW